MILKILTYPNKTLTQKTKPAGEINAEIKKLIDDMAETMYAAPGVGLAANQVGVSKQIAVIDIGDGLKALINPKITQKKEQQTDAEGCLSLPGIEFAVKRPLRLMIKYLDKTGQLRQLKAEGLLARAICHEIDHLNGKTILNRVSLLKRLKIKKYIKNQS